MAALSLLTPANANLMLLSPEHEGQCPLREKWFGTQYSVEGVCRLFHFNSEAEGEICGGTPSDLPPIQRW